MNLSVAAYGGEIDKGEIELVDISHAKEIM
jgi:hypothetical protein